METYKVVIHKEVEITQCYHKCPYFITSMEGMECRHPFFDDKSPYECMIITHDNSKGRFPDKCPLKKENNG